MKTFFSVIGSITLLLPRAVQAAQGSPLPPVADVLFIVPVAVPLAVAILLWWRLRQLRSEKAALLARLRLAQQTLEQAPLPILQLNDKLEIVEANRFARQSCQEQYFAGRNLLELEPELTGHPVLVALQSREEGALPPVSSDAPAEAQPSGRGTLALLKVDDQRGAVWFGKSSDTNQQIKAASSAASLAEESAHRMKSEFIANINHEVRTPMNAIIGYAEMLANGELGPREKRFVSIIHKSSMALVSIFNDIMELSKIDSGRLQIMASSVRLPTIINEVEGLFREQAEEKGLRFRCGLVKQLPPSYILDGLRLKQVLQNLVSNAVKFTKEGSVELLVDGSPSPGKADCYDLCFTVVDSGIGIPAGDQEKIFELFQQRENSISKQYGGVGLGLTLCSRLVAMMGGRIELYSNEGEGARFTVVLETIQIAESVPAERAEKAPVSGEHGAKILVVDDVDLIKDVFIDFFQDSPYTILTVNKGEEALRVAAAEKPRIIFMDLNLAGMDGRTVTKQLRCKAETAMIPVVVMTGEMLEEADYKLLFDDFLQKPFRLEALKEIVTRYVQPRGAGGTPSAVAGPAGGEDPAVFAGIAGTWTEELEQLRCQAVRSGSLSDAVSLGTAMLQTGQTLQQPLLAAMGEDLRQYASEPNIQGVDRLLAQLSRIVIQKEL